MLDHADHTATHRVTYARPFSQKDLGIGDTVRGVEYKIKHIN